MGPTSDTRLCRRAWIGQRRELGISLWEASHLRDTSSAEFVAMRSFVGWPIMAFVVFWLIFYVRARLDPVEHRLRSAMAYDSSVGG